MRFDKFCPHNWEFKKIEDRCSLITSGGTPLRSNKSFFSQNGGIPWVKTKELQNSYIDDTEEHITKEAIDSSSAKILPTKSVLIAMYGATVGELGIISKPMACNQACCSLTVDEETDDEKFLFYQLLSKKKEIKSQAIGAAQQNISATFIRSLELPTPKISEQKAIAKILGTIDEKIVLNKKTNETLEEIAKALFKSWFIDFDPVKAKAEGRSPGLPDEISDLFPDSFEDSELGQIPLGWEYGKLGNYVSIKRGGSPRPIKDFIVENGIPWVKISDATASKNRFIFSTKEFIKSEGLSKTVFLNEGSLILSNSATPGLPKFLELDACIHDGWLHFPEKEKFSDLYLYQLFLSIRSKLCLLGNGSVFTNLKTDILKNYNVIIPSKECLDLFDMQVDSLHQRCKSLQRSSNYLCEIRNILLTKLISGELRIPDAEKILGEVGT